jgi:hypothetical protein
MALITGNCTRIGKNPSKKISSMKNLGGGRKVRKKAPPLHWEANKCKKCPESSSLPLCPSYLFKEPLK